jgi:CspA family cold shock protein
MKGQIVTIKEQGFGFISSEELENNLFFHASDLENTEFNSLQEGQEVEFEVAEGRDGKSKASAVNVL